MARPALQPADDTPDSLASATAERILAAALAAFAEKGFDGASTRDIASGAGVNVALIKYYFGGKLQLWRAAVDRAFVDLRRGLAELEAPAGPDGERERMCRLLRRFVRFVADKPEFVRMMHDEGKRRGPRMRWLVDRHVEPMYRAIRSLLERMETSGDLPPGLDPVHLHYILVGSVALVFHQAEECRRLTGSDPSDPAFVERHADTIERLFLGAPREESPS